MKTVNNTCGIIVIKSNLHLHTKVRCYLQRKIFTYLSIIFLFLTFLIGLAPQYILGISMTIPFILGISGLIFAILGIKGPTRMILVVLNSFILVVFIGIYLMAFYGFNKP